MNKQSLYALMLCIFFQGFLLAKDCKQSECPTFRHVAAGTLFSASAILALGSVFSFNVVAHPDGNSLFDFGIFTLIGSGCLAAGAGCFAGGYLIHNNSPKGLYECLQEYWMRGEEDAAKLQQKLHDLKEKYAPNA